MSAKSNAAAAPVTFRTQAAWKRWLAKHHRTDPALVVRIYKAHAADRSRRTTSHWVMRAKKEETRARRLATLIDCSARQTTIGLLTPAR
jgi:hypothetical protein